MFYENPSDSSGVVQCLRTDKILQMANTLENRIRKLPWVLINLWEVLLKLDRKEYIYSIMFYGKYPRVLFALY
jgi:hypothetical protein